MKMVRGAAGAGLIGLAVGLAANFDLAATDNCTGATSYYTGTDTVRGGIIVAANVVQTG
jgi:hypothetical protein